MLFKTPLISKNLEAWNSHLSIGRLKLPQTTKWQKLPHKYDWVQQEMQTIKDMA